MILEAKIQKQQNQGAYPNDYTNQAIAQNQIQENQDGIIVQPSVRAQSKGKPGDRQGDFVSAKEIVFQGNQSIGSPKSRDKVQRGTAQQKKSVQGSAVANQSTRKS